MTSGGTLAITVDVEFFDSAFRFRDRAPDAVPDESREMGIEGIEFVADLLEERSVRGTFFTLGEVAEQVPEVIADLADRGHEVASHGYSKSHPDLRKREDAFVRRELEESKRILEEVTGEPIEGFRAPAFALNGRVVEILADVGYRYDSSVVPSRRIPGFYGTPDGPRDPFPSEAHFGTPGLMEFPVATAPWLRLPLSGAWMRLLGRRYARWGIESHLGRHEATVLYVHPWELVDVPQYDPIPWRVAWRTGAHVRETLRGILEAHADRVDTLGSLRERLEGRTPREIP